MNEEEFKILRKAGIKPDVAKIALHDATWIKWLEERKQENDQALRLANMNMVAGTPVKEKGWNDRETVIECYENYLRMAQLDKRSEVSFVIEYGRQRGRPILSMTFEEYLQDCIKALDWRITTDLPKLGEAEEDGRIGISKREMQLSIELCKLTKNAIENYLKMNEEQRLIYV